MPIHKIMTLTIIIEKNNTLYFIGLLPAEFFDAVLSGFLLTSITEMIDASKTIFIS